MADTFLDKVENMTDNVVKNRRFVAMTRFEKTTLLVILVTVITLMSGAVFTRSQVSSLSAQISQVQAEVNTISVENQVLQQKIDDLSTFERIEQVAKQYGLTRNLDNVRTIIK